MVLNDKNVTTNWLLDDHTICPKVFKSHWKPFTSLEGRKFSLQHNSPNERYFTKEVHNIDSNPILRMFAIRESYDIPYTLLCEDIHTDG